MSDMHWACPDCGHHLSIDEQGIGRQVHCTACGHTVVVPPVGSHWYCTECHQKLGASSELVGKTVHCDKCGAAQTVPAPAKTTGAVKIDLSTFSKTRTDSQKATALICPKCGAKLALGATLCSHCMYNLISEKEPDVKKSASAAGPPAPGRAGRVPAGEALKIGALLVVILACGVLTARHYLGRGGESTEAAHRLNMAYAEFTGFYDYFTALSLAATGHDTLSNGFFLRNYALADMDRVRADPALHGSPVFPLVRDLFGHAEDLHRVWTAAEQHRLLRGGEVAELVKRHPQLAPLVRGQGAGATLAATEALQVLQQALAPIFAEGIQRMSQ